MHISIEGMDGVGKTTICQLLSERTGFEFIDKPLRFLFDPDGSYDEYIRIRDYVNSREDRKFTSWFYGLGSLYMYDAFRGKNVITDRHILSNYLWSGTEESGPVFDTLLGLIGFPDYTFIIYADEETVTERLKSRDKNDSDLIKARKTESAYNKMESFAKEKGMPYQRIDTSDMAPDAVCDMIINKLISEGLIHG